IISRDIALTTRLLQVANSVFYVGRNTISSVEEAAVRMGLASIKDMIFAFSLISQFKWTGKQEQHLDEIVEHSSRVNACLKEVHKAKFGVSLKPEMDSIGITHDIGKVLLLQYFPDRYMEAAEKQARDPILTFHDCECLLGHHGSTHSEIGAYFLDMWNLSDIMVEIALHHHKPEKAGEKHAGLVQALAFSDSLVEYLDGNNDPDDPGFPCSAKGYLREDDLRKIITGFQKEKIKV
ncbi:MAG: HDOD domain-containing protein, partial [Planctomycetota bacterium]